MHRFNLSSLEACVSAAEALHFSGGLPSVNFTDLSTRSFFMTVRASQIRPFSCTVQRRRRPTPVQISTQPHATFVSHVASVICAKLSPPNQRETCDIARVASELGSENRQQASHKLLSRRPKSVPLRPIHQAPCSADLRGAPTINQSLSPFAPLESAKFG
jgi:hypothetical protein